VKIVKVIGAIILVLLIMAAITFLTLGWDKFFSPKFENVRRDVFEATKSYNQGKVQELAKYKLEYERATGTDKDAIASAIRHTFADYNNSKLDSQLKGFLQKVRGY